MALILRCQKAIFSAYRVDQYADAEGFMTQLGAVLEEFSDEVVLHVSNPRTGIQRRSKWPPTISEIVEACEDHVDYLRRLRMPRREALPSLPAMLLRDRPDGYLANCFVPDTHGRYPSLVAWAETAERPYWKFGKSSDGRSGIGVNLGIWDGLISMRSDRTNPEQVARMTGDGNLQENLAGWDQGSLTGSESSERSPGRE
jgi:hypothetical protein